MAKSRGFFGQRRGSTKSMTFSVLRGQQITKDRVIGGANPKTKSQMIQRMMLAQAVKFFKNAKAGFFKFAYEDQKPLESEYNAFVRHNVKNAVSVVYSQYKDKLFPSLGAYQLSKGSLQSIETQWAEAFNQIEFGFNVGALVTTLGGLSTEILRLYPTLQIGDIVTIAIVHTALNDESEIDDEYQPRWDLRQFIIDPNSTKTLASLGIALEDAGQEGGKQVKLPVIRNLDNTYLDVSHAIAYGVVVSRNTPAGLKVSTTSIVGNSLYLDYTYDASQPGAISSAATSWGATDPAILQGALV